MIPKLAARIARFFADNGIIGAEETEVYAYGVELLCSAVTNFAVYIAVALLLHTLLPCAVFQIAFAVLRRNTGGYHANSHLGCNAVLAVVLTVFSLLCHWLPVTGKLALTAAVLLLVPVPVIRWAPVEHPHKPLEPELRQSLHRYACIFMAIEAVCTILLWILRLREAVFWTACGMAAAVVSMAFEHVRKRKN